MTDPLLGLFVRLARSADHDETWPGTRIELYPTKTQMGGWVVDCIRIRATRQRRALELGAIWDGIDRLERGGSSLDAIARPLTLDWETSAIALAMIGRRP
jgi:hypothetical protein